MALEEIQLKTELLQILRRRKHELDKQAAIFGAASDPAITIQREDLQQEIEQLEKEIQVLQTSSQAAASPVEPSRAMPSISSAATNPQVVLVTSLEETPKVQTPTRSSTTSRSAQSKRPPRRRRENLVVSAFCFGTALLLVFFPELLGVPTMGIAGFFALVSFWVFGFYFEPLKEYAGLSDMILGVGFLFIPLIVWWYAGISLWSIVPIVLLALFACVGIGTGLNKYYKKKQDK